jgi:hypothetical protein
VFNLRFIAIHEHPIGFPNVLINTFSYFSIFFAIGDSLSYIRNWKLLRNIADLKASYVIPPLSLIFVGFFFSIFRFFGRPYLTNALLVILGLVFGFSFRSELIDEAGYRVNSKCKGLFDHSLIDNTPYVIVAFLVVFPLESLLQVIANNTISKVVVYVVLFCVFIAFSYKLTQKNIIKFEIKENNTIGTGIIIVLLSLISFTGLIIWDVTALARFALPKNNIELMFFLFVLGIIPIRIIPLLFFKAATPIRILQVMSLLYYLVSKMTYSVYRF